MHNDISNIQVIEELNHEVTEPFQLEEVVYESIKFPTVFFAKRNMKTLLDQRMLVSTSLNFTSKKSKPNSAQQINQSIGRIIISVFDECPSPLDQHSLIIFDDCYGYYGFFSTDGKYVPLCKLCNVSLYTVTRGYSTKLVCCNSKCKKKVLGEVMEVPENVSYKKTNKKVSARSESTHREEKKKLSLKDMEKIRRASKKILYEN